MMKKRQKSINTSSDQTEKKSLELSYHCKN